MLILALDASGKTAGAALVSEERVIAEFTINNGYTHSRTLMPLTGRVFDMSGISPAEIDLIACTSGPGSFTGLRIGAAAAMGLAAGLSKDLVEIPTLDALAYNVFKTDSPGKGYVMAIMDARRDQLYASVYSYANGVLARETEYIADSVDTVIAAARSLGDDITVVGDGVFPHRERLITEGFVIAPVCHMLQRPASVGALALTGAYKAVKPDAFKLLYLRKPQAERELEARSEARGNG
ncbi:MAG: tRNA (adenosine(37)-N6)-threonylcarbamoyltransferase complex dimerization subunit type 1 TsaB [Clostridiales bacterium]|jgi:tRNA threonylcarbamoyladenosine biosynthesis protein TsaB|nr:tRNA (adenosine(37)-N6)-threonylcarbamoyltransferase complex dimerization subunit type 1 TsaB [Clostridiales bacterium]